MKLPPNKTKIICTIGPSSSSSEVIEQMILAGMDVARLNFSHGDFTNHAKAIRDLRAAAQTVGKQIAIMADLPGPKIRVGKIANEPIQLKPGGIFTLTTDEILGNANRVSVTFKRLPQTVKPADILFLNDGLIQLEVTKIRGSEVICKVMVGGELRSRKGLNLPGIDLGISAFTDHDYNCMKFALENGVDAVSQSFVNQADDIKVVRSAAADLGYRPFIIAKVERASALDNINEIIEAADGIMIARGDLGVEVPIERIAIIQKWLIRLANMHAKPVITATQMLESMTENRRPTRAEATDVANAILDGTDCVMLSEESAMGKYPVDAVAMLAKIAATTEPHRPAITAGEMFKGVDLKGKLPPAHLIALSVERSLEYASPAAVFVPTHSGATARSIARFRLPVWIVAVSSQETTCQHLKFSYGVYPVHEPDHPENWKIYVREWLHAYAVEGNIVVLTEGPSTKYPEANNRMEIIDLDRS